MGNDEIDSIPPSHKLPTQPSGHAASTMGIASPISDNYLPPLLIYSEASLSQVVDRHRYGERNLTSKDAKWYFMEYHLLYGIIDRGSRY